MVRSSLWVSMHSMPCLPHSIVSKSLNLSYLAKQCEFEFRSWEGWLLGQDRFSSIWLISASQFQQSCIGTYLFTKTHGAGAEVPRIEWDMRIAMKPNQASSSLFIHSFIHGPLCLNMAANNVVIRASTLYNIRCRRCFLVKEARW